jgi:hypothetical protein
MTIELGNPVDTPQHAELGDIAPGIRQTVHALGLSAHPYASIRAGRP